jgi:hypothetical protein
MTERRPDLPFSLGVQHRVQAQFLGVVEVLLDPGDDVRRRLREAAGNISHPGRQVPVRHDLADQPQAGGHGRAEFFVAEIEVAGAARTHQAGQQPGAAEVPGQPRAEERGAEHRGLGGDPQVAGAGPGQPGARAGAVDRRDGRLGHLVQQFGGPVQPPELRDAGPGRARFRELSHRAEVTTRAEAPARAGQHQHPDGLVRAHLL